MLNILSSTAAHPNEALDEPSPREGAEEDNLSWLSRNLAGGEGALVLLLGGRGPVDRRLRIAQAELRLDLSPSAWSHAALVDEPGDEPGDARVVEISLEPPNGFGLPSTTNGVQESTLARYADPEAWPNVAVLRIPLDPAEVSDAVERFRGQRAALDAVDLTVAWLAWAWGAGTGHNPLMEGVGVPSAALVEAAATAVGYDLTPGLESRASCPEAIWQAARWWHPFYDERDRGAPEGAWVADHWIE